ncbi:hypothetical protein GGTG_03223 [Gaeumannomyces tritici R3-111a-1]|uniref:Transcription factor domain-containing protein n=1 Tax=Gaeumannomyces tritici (strain R3-111a-1) TaxID=644352 RepID=J3NPL5_GAET3|nr:hypothetical protein GGTG_03223 [Gaeumannomyces tritici R3-111a-1]EJT78120.1 hypothetical protein GGTG_03223 [Gaeumannomyces tritici R3-111a-1]
MWCMSLSERRLKELCGGRAKGGPLVRSAATWASITSRVLVTDCKTRTQKVGDDRNSQEIPSSGASDCLSVHRGVAEPAKAQKVAKHTKLGDKAVMRRDTITTSWELSSAVRLPRIPHSGSQTNALRAMAARTAELALDTADAGALSSAATSGMAARMELLTKLSGKDAQQRLKRMSHRRRAGIWKTTSTVSPSVDDGPADSTSPGSGFPTGVVPASWSAIGWKKFSSIHSCRNKGNAHSRLVDHSGGQGQVAEVALQPLLTVEDVTPARLVKVSQRYLDDLIAENERLRAAQPGGDRPPPSTLAAPRQDAREVACVGGQQAISLDDRPWFFDLNIPNTPILLGEASDAAFATRFRQAVAGGRHIPRVNYATDEDLLALSDTDCEWPSPSRARFLVDVALRYASHHYHIVRRSRILEGLEQTLANPTRSSDSLLRCKLWALFALGEMYSARSADTAENCFPGIHYFARATRIMRICLVTATRPILLHVLRTHVASWPPRETDDRPPEPRDPAPPIPAVAMTVADACIRSARHSVQLLKEAWIDGSFATFNYFYSQYMFSAATVMAVSSLLPSGADNGSDGEHFEAAASILNQVKNNGSFAGREWCRHVDAIKTALAEARLRKAGAPSSSVSPMVSTNTGIATAARGQHSTGGAALATDTTEWDHRNRTARVLPTSASGAARA